MTHLLGLVGITIVIVHGSIFASLRARFLRSLLTCAQCTGWWVGLIGAAVEQKSLYEILLWGGAVSVLAFLVSLTVHTLNT